MEKSFKFTDQPSAEELKLYEDLFNIHTSSLINRQEKIKSLSFENSLSDIDKEMDEKSEKKFQTKTFFITPETRKIIINLK